MEMKDEKHLCDSCKEEFVFCRPDKIVFGIDVYPEAKDFDADKVLQCSSYAECHTI